jgi:hypothetical protein
MAAQRKLATLISAFLLGGTAFVPASSADADSSRDYWTASKLSFQLAAMRSKMNETSGACSALSQSLAYYRAALAMETGEPAMPTSGDGNDEGLQEIRAKFGCTVAQFG